MATYRLSHKSSKKDEQEMLGTAGEVKTNSYATFSHGLLYMETPVLANQQRPIFISFVWTLGCSKENLPRVMIER